MLLKVSTITVVDQEAISITVSIMDLIESEKLPVLCPVSRSLVPRHPDLFNFQHIKKIGVPGDEAKYHVPLP